MLKNKNKSMKHEDDGDTNCSWCAWNNPYSIGKRIGRLGYQRTSGDHPDYSIIKIGQNTEKNPGELWRLFISWTSGKPSTDAGVKNSLRRNGNNNRIS